MKYLFASLFLVIYMLPAMAQDDAKAILEKMDKVMFSAKDRVGTITITLVDKNGDEKVREAEIFQKGTDKKLYRYTKPESQAGIATLSLPGGVMWMSMPAFAKPKKISLLSKSQSFTGTDFSFEDMNISSYSDNFTPSMESVGKNDYVLLLIPKDEKSIYSKVLLRVDKANGYPIWMKYYNRQGRMFKDASYKYEKVGNYWNAKEVIMKDLEKEHSTIINLSRIKFDQGLSDDIFDVENMKQDK
ncbi:outer membrane lipoprotein-sorting protein [Maribellus mangrovi]|uniref:outer membrane lipoprotein-sorting protein n=1 Tax=Maribellus mangrovi TaxID=3133146 RepID=UPI0030EF4D4D